jgi:hypothetical protein
MRKPEQAGFGDRNVADAWLLLQKIFLRELSAS